MSMSKSRIEAFSDGVLAIVITIMVLEIKVPRGPGSTATVSDLVPLLPLFLSYALSFVYIGIYWNNHHHMFQAIQRVTGGVLWANLHLLFWLSLVPFTTWWLGETGFAPTPVALYGAILLMSALAYTVLQWTILKVPGGNPVLASAVGRDVKGKISLFAYILAIPSSFVSRWAACTLYVFVALIWLIPDRRIERAFAADRNHD